MNRRTCLIASVSVFLSVCVFFVTANPTSAQFRRVGEKATDEVPNDLLPKVKGWDRTDLFTNLPDLQTSHEDSRRAHLRDVARLAYGKLKFARERNPEAISEEVLSRTSLEWFKAEVYAAKSKAEAIKAASEYLDREGEAAKR